MRVAFLYLKIIFFSTVLFIIAGIEIDDTKLTLN